MKRNGNRFSEDLEQKIISLYNTHQNMTVVGRELNLKTTSISRVLKRFKIVIKENKSGDQHPAWKGGINNNKGDGYIGIWNPKHERADGGGYVYEHTLVYEKNTGLLPEKNEVLHHIDLDKKNNNFSNLFKCGHKKHLEIHRQIEKLIKPLMNKGIVIFENGEYKIK